MRHRIQAHLAAWRKCGVLGPAAFDAETRPALFVLRQASRCRPDARHEFRAVFLHVLSQPGSGIYL